MVEVYIYVVYFYLYVAHDTTMDKKCSHVPDKIQK